MHVYERGCLAFKLLIALKVETFDFKFITKIYSIPLHRSSIYVLYALVQTLYSTLRARERLQQIALLQPEFSAGLQPCKKNFLVINNVGAYYFPMKLL